MLLRVAVPKRIVLYSVREFVRSLYYEEQEMQGSTHDLTRFARYCKTRFENEIKTIPRLFYTNNNSLNEYNIQYTIYNIHINGV